MNLLIASTLEGEQEDGNASNQFVCVFHPNLSWETFPVQYDITRLQFHHCGIINKLKFNSKIIQIQFNLVNIQFQFSVIQYL